MLMTDGGRLPFPVEKTRQAADLKLAIKQKAPTRHHHVAVLQSSDDGI